MRGDQMSTTLASFCEGMLQDLRSREHCVHSEPKSHPAPRAERLLLCQILESLHCPISERVIAHFQLGLPRLDPRMYAIAKNAAKT